MMKRPIELLKLETKGEGKAVRHYLHPDRALAAAVRDFAPRAKPGTILTAYDRSTGRFIFDVLVRTCGKVRILYNTPIRKGA